jgi:hypothetical protein
MNLKILQKPILPHTESSDDTLAQMCRQSFDLKSEITYVIFCWNSYYNINMSLDFVFLNPQSPDDNNLTFSLLRY